MDWQQCNNQEPYARFTRRLARAVPEILVCEFNSRVLRRWCALTGNTAGIWGWGRAIPYLRDEEVGSGASFEDQAFAEWATPQNQHALMNACDTTILSDNPGILVDAAVDEAKIEGRIPRELGDRDLDALGEQLIASIAAGELSWVIVPLGPDTEFCLIGCSQDYELALDEMASFCDAGGIAAHRAHSS